MGANVFASVYGKVTEITDDHIVIEPASEQPDEFIPITESVEGITEGSAKLELVKAAGIVGMGGAFTGKSTRLDAPTTKTTGSILVTIEFPDLHGVTMGILVCACGGSEERMREIAEKMNSKVIGI